MQFDCLFLDTKEQFIIAKPHGWVWSDTEKSPPWEIVLTGDLEPQAQDYDVPLQTSFGEVVIKASQISPSLVIGGE